MVLITEGPFVRGSVAGQGDTDESRGGPSTELLGIDREEVTSR